MLNSVTNYKQLEKFNYY